jgi:hypothetical protein
MQLQWSDPIFSMGVDVMRVAFNLEPKYRVTMLTREDWTKGTGASPVVKGLVWFTDWSKMREGNRAGVYGQSLGRKLSFSLGRYTALFRLRYRLSWPLFTKFNLRTDWRNTGVSAVIVRRP